MSWPPYKLRALFAEVQAMEAEQEASAEASMARAARNAHMKKDEFRKYLSQLTHHGR